MNAETESRSTPSPGTPKSSRLAEALDHADLLLRLRIFRGLGAEELAPMARAAALETFEEEATLVAEGSEASDLLILVDGEALLERSRGGLWHQVLGEVRPGNALTLVSVIDGGRAPATIRAAGNGRVLRLPGAIVRDSMRSSPTLGFRLLQTLSRQIRSLSDLIAQLSLLSLEERLLLFLLRHAPSVEDPPEAPRPWTFTHAQLAQRIGGCREEVTRLLAKIRRKGLIEVRRREVRIVQPAELRRIAPRLEPLS